LGDGGAMTMSSWNALRRTALLARLRPAPPPTLPLLLTSALESRLWLMNASA
jgi:hypothetical protein